MKADIQNHPFMDPYKAYDFIMTEMRKVVPETDPDDKDRFAIVCSSLDHKKECITIPPIKLARKLLNAETTSLMCETFFTFCDKAFRDSLYQLEDPYSAYELAVLYYYERYNHVDYGKVIHYLEEAHFSGKTEELLGLCYYYGHGVVQDYKTAFHLLTKCALSRESPMCMYLLGDMYLNGNYVEEDPVAAENIYHNGLHISFENEDDYNEIEGLLRTGRMDIWWSQGWEQMDNAMLKFNRAEEKFMQYVQKDYYSNISEKLTEIRILQRTVRECLDHYIMHGDTYKN